MATDESNIGIWFWLALIVGVNATWICMDLWLRARTRVPDHGVPRRPPQRTMGADHHGPRRLHCGCLPHPHAHHHEVRMTTAGTVDITCACGQELHVPVTTAAPESFTGELGTLTVKLHIDHAWLAAHIATHDEAR